MPLAQIKIDQAGKPAGLPGVAREDLDLGLPVTLAAVGGPFRAYRWTIIDKALNFDNDSLSSAGLISTTNSVTQVSPIDVAGTYLIKLEVDSGAGLGRSADDITTITFYAGPVLSSEPTELPQRIPAARETTEHNVPNTPYPAGNLLGWAYAVGRWFGGVMRRLYRVGARAGARVSTSNVGPTVTEIRKLYVQSVAFDGTTYTVTLSMPFPDADYGVIVTPHESIDYGHPAWFAVTILSNTDFEIRFYDNTDTPTGADFSVLVVLGDMP